MNEWNVINAWCDISNDCDYVNRHPADGVSKDDRDENCKRLKEEKRILPMVV